MNYRIAFAFGFSLALSAAPGGSLPVRDVLATAFSHPFQTDLEVIAYRSDTRALVQGSGKPALFHYPGIAALTANGEAVPARRIEPDLIQADLPSRELEIEITACAGGALPLGKLEAGPVVGTAEELKHRAANLKPGEQLVVRDGIYTGWKVELSLAGTPGQPVVIRPQTPGGVTFRRDSRLILRGQHGVFREFRFEQCNSGPVLGVQGSDCRVTQCHFAQCGTPISTFSHIVQVGMDSHRNRVDHCYFTGSKSMSLAQSIKAVDGVGRNNRFDHNLFRDIYRYWINGQENIQIGQNQRDPTGKARPECLVEYNLFDHAWGDGEIISSKSSGNAIRRNVAAHCLRSAFTLRGGNEALFEGNAIVGTGDGLRVMGQRHRIANNLILNPAGWGIYLETGSVDGQDMVATTGTVVAHNTIVKCPAGAVGVMPATAKRPHLPAGNEFSDNLFLSDASVLGDPARLPESTVRHNLFWIPGRSVQPAPIGTDAVVADPRLQGDWLDLLAEPDGPAKGLGAAAPDGGLPPLPARPLLELSLFKGKSLFAQNPKEPLAGWAGPGKAAKDALSLEDTGSAKLETLLPESFVLEWDYQPDQFAATGSLSFADWELTWGGVSGDGKPTGVIELHKAGKTVADGMDALLPSQQFRYEGGGMNFKADARKSPGSQLWYRFGLLKRGGRLILLLTGARQEYGRLPVIVWQDREPRLGSTELTIKQRGTGRWRGFALHACEYAGDVPPRAPQKLTAVASGAGRVTLRWQDVRPGLTYEVFRGAEAGFAADPEYRVATGMRGRFDDFQVQPGNRYFYQVRAVNPLGIASGFAKADATAGSTGAGYRIISASRASIAAPMVLERNPGEDEFLWAPPGTSGDPAPDSGAEFVLPVEKSGDYTVWGLVRAPDGSADSFHYAFDGGKRGIWYTGIHPGFGWSRIGPRQHLEKGEHRLRVQHREPGAALAAVLVTDDLAFEK